MAAQFVHQSSLVDVAVTRATLGGLLPGERINVAAHRAAGRPRIALLMNRDCGLFKCDRLLPWSL